MFKLSKRSIDRLDGVHPRLVEVVKLAIKLSSVDFGVSEGVRTKERQRMLVEAGKSKTMNSRHLVGEAVDLFAYVDGKASWDWPHYEKINEAMQEAARQLNVKITWGGSWRSFKDGVHWQIEL